MVMCVIDGKKCLLDCVFKFLVVFEEVIVYYVDKLFVIGGKLMGGWMVSLFVDYE